MGGVRPAPLRQAQAAGGSGRDRYGYSVSVLLPTHHKKVRTCRTRQIRARSPGSDFLMIRIQMPSHWNNHSGPTPIRPFFLPSGFSSCRRGNKKSVLFPASPSPQEFGRSIIILTFCIETCYIFVNTYKYFVGEHFILPFKGPGRYTRGVRTEA